MNTLNTKLTCPTCNRAFSTSFSRKRHEKTHKEAVVETKVQEEEPICKLAIYRETETGKVSVKLQ